MKFPSHILKDDAAEKLNNFFEKWMLYVKLLNNCLNIGCKEAAENKAFAFYLLRIVRLTNEPQDYLKYLLNLMFMARASAVRSFCLVLIRLNFNVKLFS